MIAAIGVVGACGTARVQIGYLVLVENLPSSKHALVGSSLFIFETMIGISASIYFSYAKYWFWFALVGYILECFATLASLVMSETPKFLMKSGRKEEFKALLKRISKWNRINELENESYQDLDNFRVQDVSSIGSSRAPTFTDSGFKTSEN